jgi:hypothetical protein
MTDALWAVGGHRRGTLVRLTFITARPRPIVVDFYNERFQMGLTDEQKEQLVAFLHSL